MPDGRADEVDFERFDRRSAVRATAEQLVERLRDPLVVQGDRVFGELEVGVADGVRRRLLLTAQRQHDGIHAGPCVLRGIVDGCRVRMPALVLAVDEATVTLHIDPARAEVEERRAHERLRLRLPVRGQPVPAGPPWTASTVNVSAGGALLDVALVAGSEHRLVLGLPAAELQLSGGCAWVGEGGSAIVFNALASGGARALDLALVRAAVAGGVRL